MSNKFTFLFFCYFLVSLPLVSQKMGEVRFRTGPPIGELLLKIGDSILTTTNVQLPEGTYDIQLWAPTYEPFDTTISVQSDTTIYFRKVLTPTLEYTQYNADLQEYKKKAILPTAVSAGVSTLVSLSAYLAYRDAKQKLDFVYRAKQNFEFIGPDHTIDYYDLFQQSKPDYEKSRKKYHKLGIASIVCWSATTYVFIRSRRIQKPVFTSDPPPFSVTANFFDGLQSTTYQPELIFSYVKNF